MDQGDRGGGAGRGWTRLRRRVLHDGHLRLVRDRVRLPSGAEIAFESLDQGICACTLARTGPDRYLFLRQYRYPIDELSWEIPMGDVETGETVEAAARREVLEETGYVLGDLEPMGRMVPSNGQSSQRMALFFGDVAGRRDARPEASETFTVHELSAGEIWRLVDAGEISDAATLAAVLFAYRRGRFPAPGGGGPSAARRSKTG